MKNNLLKKLILAFCLCSNFILFAQIPGDTGNGSGGVEGGDLTAPSSTGDGSGGLEGEALTVPGSTGDGSGGVEGNDTTAVPIDTYLWILALLVILYVFFKYRSIQNKKIQS